MRMTSVQASLACRNGGLSVRVEKEEEEDGVSANCERDLPWMQKGIYY